MLVLTVKPGEGVCLTLPDGREVWVRLTSSVGRVRLGFEAPRDVMIERDSVRMERLRKEKQTC